MNLKLVSIPSGSCLDPGCKLVLEGKTGAAAAAGSDEEKGLLLGNPGEENELGKKLLLTLLKSF